MTTLRRASMLLVVWVGSAPVISSAHESAAPAPLASPDPGELRELLDAQVEAASKLPQVAREAPAAVGLVTAAAIEAYGWRTLNELLWMQPGFFPSHQYERWTVGGRGLFENWYNNHLLLLVDGIPFGDVETGSAYTFSQTPMLPWRAVEVVRGPGSALYGSGAVYGVVDLKTRAIEPELRSIWAVRVGEHGRRTYDLTVSGAGRLAAALVAINQDAAGSDGFRTPDASGRTDPSGALATFPVRSDRESLYVLAKLEGREALDGLSLQLHHQAWGYQLEQGFLYFSPEQEDQARESRDMAILRYRTPRPGAVSTDLALRLQRHGYEYFIRMLPAGATLGLTYPSGADETLVTRTDDLFLRGEVAWRLGRGSLLGGAEYSGLLNRGDARHTATFDTRAGGDYAPLPGPIDVGDVYAPIVGRPVHRVGLFAQAVSGPVFGGWLSGTASVRWDGFRAEYRDLADPTQPLRTKASSRLTPRLGLVATPTDRLSVKLLGAYAYRAPAPTELFSANTIIQLSNARTLRPEELRSAELEVTWLPVDRVELSVNGYWLRLENLISLVGTDLANVLTRENAGIEAQVRWDYELAGAGRLAGFANASRVWQLDEVALHPAIERSGDLTWAPELTGKLGLELQLGRLKLAGSVLHQGRVRRRAEDALTPEFAVARPASVAPWTTITLNAMWQLRPWLQGSVRVWNVLDANASVAAMGDLPFDHRMSGRQTALSLTADL